ncbi:MAG: helix-turn-helix domain-containing protein [Planctomycetales bacterium]
MTTKTTDRLLLSPREAAEALSISPRSLWALSAPRGPIPTVRIGRSVRYSPTDLSAWIEAQKEGGA